MIRIAAVADVHFGAESRGRFRNRVGDLPQCADVLLVAGDLTKCGSAEEAQVCADELKDLGVPVVVVLGNHDYHAGQEHLVTKILSESGIIVLEGDSITFDINGLRLGIAGTKGFGGGFAGACGTDFGEPEMKAFVWHTKRLASDLEESLRALDVDQRVVLLHYAPVRDTLAGEPLEIYPFLGSYLLAEAIDGIGADLVVHGHAHHGTEKGLTPGGVIVRNVAQPVIHHAYNLYRLGTNGAGSGGGYGDERAGHEERDHDLRNVRH